MKAKEVKIYSTPTCPWCKRAKRLLDDNHVSYQDFNVAEDIAAREEMMRKSGRMAVPVIEIDGEVTVGYDEAWMKQKLGL